MTQEEKELLLKDLCARLPYGIKILHETWNYEWDQEMTLLERVVGIDERFIYVKVIDDLNGEEYRDDKICVDTFDDKMFLRPMSSMTNEEKEEERKLWNIITTTRNDSHYLYTDFLVSHHFDYRGLIKMGLALEAPENMYNIK